MKILHIAQSAGYGVTIYLESLIKGLKSKEYEQVILGSEYYNTEHFRTLADKVVTIPMCRNISPHDVQTILQCMKIVRQVRPEIVYCHSAKAGIYGRIACLGTKTKVVYNPHGWSFNMHRSKISTFVYKAIEYVFSWFTDIIIIISNFEFNSTPKCFPTKKLAVITNGIDVERNLKLLSDSHLEKNKLGIPSDAYVVGIVGRISIQKGQDLFVKAAKRIKDVIPNAYFLIVGGKSDDVPIEDIIKENDLQDSFTITGEVTDAIRYASLFDVALFTSRWEGFGLVLPEYMLAKKPVVAFAVDAAVDIIKDRETGILVPANDIDLMANSVLMLYENKEFADKLVSNAYKEVISKYDLKRVVIEHEKLFDAIVKKK